MDCVDPTVKQGSLILSPFMLLFKFLGIHMNFGTVSVYYEV